MTKLVASLSTEGKLEIIPYASNLVEILTSTLGQGSSQVFDLSDDLKMWVHMDAKENKMPFNQAATSIFLKFLGAKDYICGNVLLTGTLATEHGEVEGLDERTVEVLKAYAALSQIN